MENLKKIIGKYLKLKVGIIGSGVVFLLALYAYNSLVLASPGHNEAASEAKTPESSSQVITIQETELEKLGISNISFAGEVLSTDDVQIHPLVEGQLSELKVKIGQYVRKGQVLGRLSVAPNPDLIATLAEKAKSAERARLQIGVIGRITYESKQRIEALKTILDRSRDSAILTIDKEALQNLNFSQGATQKLNSQKQAKDAIIRSAQAEYEQAQAALKVEFLQARKAAEKAYIESASVITDHIGLSPGSVLMDANLNYAYGHFDQNSRQNFAQTFMMFKKSLDDQSRIPESEVATYFDATKRLILSSYPNNYVTAEKLKNIRETLTENEKDYYEAIKDYQAANGHLAQKQADYEKVKAEQDRDIVDLEVGAKNAQSAYEIAESLKDAKRTEIETDIEKQKFEYDDRLIDLLKEKLFSEAEAAAAGAAYNVFVSKIGGQEITALRSGYISGVYKNVGDHVTPETAVVAITGSMSAPKFVRFKIPADSKLVSVGESVEIESPNFQSEKTEARVAGVSLSLDSNGFFLADADLSKDANLPVHARVRVVPKINKKVVVVPLSAIVFGQDNKNILWTLDKENMLRKKEVKIGRTFGDQVEILEGAALGMKILTKPKEDLVDGSKWEGDLPVKEQDPAKNKAEEKSQGGDGHAHSHGE